VAWTDPASGSFASSEIVTATKLNTFLRDNMKELWHETNYTEFVSDVTTTTATEAAPLDVASAGATSYSAYPIIVEFYSPHYQRPNQTGVNLWDASTDLGRISDAGTNVAGTWHSFPFTAARRLTPTAASHTYKMRIWTAGGGTAILRGGTGGAGVNMPGYIRVLQRGG